MTRGDSIFEQWADDWAYILLLLAMLGMAAAATAVIALPVWIVADVLEGDAFPDQSTVWGLGAWAVSFLVFGPRFVRVCRPVIEGFGRKEGS